MKYLLYAALTCAIMFAVPRGEAHAQFRYGFEGGAVLHESKPTYSNEDGGLYISGMLFGIRGEFHYRVLELYAAPQILLNSAFRRIELPMGAKMRFHTGVLSPYVSGALALAYHFPVELHDRASYLRSDAMHRSYVSDAPYIYDPLDLRFHVGFGFELGSYDRSVFTLELRFCSKIGALTQPYDPRGLPENEINIVTGFLWR